MVLIRDHCWLRFAQSRWPRPAALRGKAARALRSRPPLAPRSESSAMGIVDGAASNHRPGW